MPASRDRMSLIKAARMYFLDGRSQDDIARVLGTSRSNVSRMLTAARAQGIVEIRVHGQAARAGELEQALRERFGLAHVRVAAFRPGGGRRGRCRGPGRPVAGRVAARRIGTGAVLGDVTAGHGLGGRGGSAAQRGGRSAGRRFEDGGVPRRRPGVGAGTGRAPRGDLPVPPRSGTAAVEGGAARHRRSEVGANGRHRMAVGTVGTGSSNEVLDGLGLTAPSVRRSWLAGPVGDTAAGSSTRTAGDRRGRP